MPGTSASPKAIYAGDTPASASTQNEKHILLVSNDTTSSTIRRYEEELSRVLRDWQRAKEDNSRLLADKAALQEELITALKAHRERDERLLLLRRDLADSEFELDQLRIAFRATAEHCVTLERANTHLERANTQLEGSNAQLVQQCTTLRQAAEARGREAREGLEGACAELRRLCGELQVQLSEEGVGEEQQQLQQQAVRECGDGSVGLAGANCVGRGGAGVGQLRSGDARACDSIGCAVVVAVAAADAAGAAGQLSTAAVGARLERLEALGRELQRLAQLYAAPLDPGPSTAPKEATVDLPNPCLHSPPPSPGPGPGPAVCKEPPTLFTTSHASSSLRSPSRGPSPSLSPRPSASACPSPSPGADALGLVYTLSPRNSSMLVHQQHSANSNRGGALPGSRPLSMHDLHGGRAPPNTHHLHPQDPAQDPGYPSASPALLLLAATAAAAAAPRPKRVGDGAPWETEGAPAGPRAGAGAGVGAGRGARAGGRARGASGTASGSGRAAGEGSKDVAAAPALQPLSAGPGSEAADGSVAHADAASAAVLPPARLLPSGPCRSGGSSGSSGGSGTLGRLASVSTGPPTPGTPDPRPAAGPQDPLPLLPPPLVPGPSDALTSHAQQRQASAGHEGRKAGGSAGGIAASLPGGGGGGGGAAAANTPAAPKALEDHPVLLQLANEALRRQVAELQRQNDLLQLQLLGTGVAKAAGPGAGAGGGTGPASGAGPGAGGAVAGAGLGTGPSGGLGGTSGAGTGVASQLAGGRVGLTGPVRPTGVAAGGREEAAGAGSGGTKVAGPTAAAAVAGLGALAAAGAEQDLGGSGSGGAGGGDAGGAAAGKAAPVLEAGSSSRAQPCSASAAQAAAFLAVSAPHAQGPSCAERSRGTGEFGGQLPGVSVITTPLGPGSSTPLGPGPAHAKEQKERQAAQRCHWGILAHTAAPEHLDPFYTAYFGSLPPGASQASHQAHHHQQHQFPLSSSPGSRQGVLGYGVGLSCTAGVFERGSAGGSCGGAAGVNRRGQVPTSHRRTASAEHLSIPVLPPAWQLEQQQQQQQQQLTSCPGVIAAEAGACRTPSANAEGSTGRQEGTPGEVDAAAAAAAAVAVAGGAGRNASWSCGQRAAPSLVGASVAPCGGPEVPSSAIGPSQENTRGGCSTAAWSAAAAAAASVGEEPLVCSTVAARGLKYGNPAGSPLALLSPPVSVGSPECSARAQGGSSGAGAVGGAGAPAGAVFGTSGQSHSATAPQPSRTAASPVALWEDGGLARAVAGHAATAGEAAAEQPPLEPTGIRSGGQERQGKQQPHLLPPPGVDPELWELELLVSSSRRK